MTANTIATPARRPLVTNCLLPEMTHLPSLSTARVRRLFASEPACGSVRQNAPMISPLASFGRYSAFCASVPNLRIGPQPTELCTLISVAHEAQPAAISSIASA